MTHGGTTRLTRSMKPTPSFSVQTHLWVKPPTPISQDSFKKLKTQICNMMQQQQQPTSQQQQGLLQDLLTPINQNLTTFPNGDLFWDTSYNEEDDSLLAASSSSFLQLISSSIEPSFPCSCFTGETVEFPAILPNLDSFTPESRFAVH